MERKTVYVYSDWHADATPQLIGELQIQNDSCEIREKR